MLTATLLTVLATLAAILTEKIRRDAEADRIERAMRRASRIRFTNPNRGERS